MDVLPIICYCDLQIYIKPDEWMRSYNIDMLACF